MSARAAGFIAAGCTTVIALGLIGWALIGQSAEDDRPASEPIDEQFGEAPVIDENVVPAQPETIDSTIIDEAQGGRIRGQDPKNPSRTSWEIRYEVLDPQEGGRFLITEPIARIFLNDGTTAQLTADSASLLSPAGTNRPESGRFTGNVLAHLYSDDPDAPGAEPDATLKADTLSFDIAIGEISTSGPVEITSDGVLLNTAGVKIIFDETNRRLAFLGVESGGSLMIDPVAMREASSDSGADAEPNDRAVANRPTPSDDPTDAEPAEQIYHTEITGGVRFSGTGRTVVADRIDLWARLIDDAIPADAVHPVIAASRSAEDSTDAGASQGDSSRAGDAPSTLNFTWDGPLELRPSDSTPEQLAEDHLAVRLTSPESGKVTLHDDAVGATLTCVDLGYGVTTGRLALAGRGSSGVTLRLPDLVETVCGRIDLDMTTGHGSLSGPGVAQAIGLSAKPADGARAEAPRREISWDRSCDFLLATRDGALDPSASPPLDEVIFNANVNARYDGAELSAEFARAIFSADPNGRTFMSRLALEDNVNASAGEEGDISAETIEVAFDQQEGGADTWTPTVVTATGRVRASRAGVTLRAALAEARLARQSSGEISLQSFSADRDVVITSPEQLEAYADEVRLAADTGVAELIGRPAVLRYKEASITGGSMRLEESPRRLTVFGDSVVNYSRPQQGALGYRRVQVESSEQMIYDDETGRVEFIGDCIATAEPGELERHVARAHRMVVDVTPGMTRQRDDNAADAPPESHIRRLTAYGEAGETVEADPVEVESRIYAAADDTTTGLRLERLFYAEGPQITVRAEENDLVIPGAGRILVENRDAAPDRDRDAARFASGTILLEWDGDLAIDRDTGIATMTRRVRLRQRPSPDAEVAQLECERLETELRVPKAPDATDPEARVELIRAEASGAVYAASGARQIIADALIYDGARGVAEAIASPGNLITLFDEQVPAPLTGSVLRWDLIRDRIEWFDAGETTIPR